MSVGFGFGFGLGFVDVMLVSQFRRLCIDARSIATLVHLTFRNTTPKLLSWARSTYDSEHYEPTYPFGEPSDNVSTTTMYYHGGYIVPWGCTVQ